MQPTILLDSNLNLVVSKLNTNYILRSKIKYWNYK